jgi:hypothetical protein
MRFRLFYYDYLTKKRANKSSIHMRFRLFRQVFKEAFPFVSEGKITFPGGFSQFQYNFKLKKGKNNLFLVGMHYKIIKNLSFLCLLIYFHLFSFIYM